jgi:hypothetical protein
VMPNSRARSEMANLAVVWANWGSSIQGTK